jgi:hypothetical protein
VGLVAPEWVQRKYQSESRPLSIPLSFPLSIPLSFLVFTLLLLPPPNVVADGTVWVAIEYRTYKRSHWSLTPSSQ